MNRKAAQLLYAPLFGHPWIVAAAFFCVLITSLSQALIPLSIGGIYGQLFPGETGKGRLLEEFGMATNSVSHALILFFVLVGIRMIAGFGEKVTLSYLSGELIHHVRSRLFHSLIATPADQLPPESTARRIVHFTSELTAIQNFFAKGIVGGIADILFLILAVTLLFLLDAHLGTTVVLFIPGCLLLFVLISQPIVRSLAARNDRKASWLQFVTSRLQAGIAIQALNRENKEMRRFDQLSRQLSADSQRTSVLQGLGESLIPALFFGLIGVLLLQAARAETPPDQATLTTFVLMVLYMQRTFRRIVRLPAVFRSGSYSLSKVSSRITTSGSQQRDEAGKKTRMQISIHGLEIHEGTSVLPARFIELSHNGPGLTAIMSADETVRRQLTQRLLDLSQGSGEIMLDGKSYAEWGSYAVRKKIAVCSPQIPLYGKKLFDAISWNTSPEDQQEAINLLSSYGLWAAEQVSELLHTPLHEGLSDSTLRPLELARAELTGKHILIAEEPLAGCDPLTSAFLVNRLNRMSSRNAIIYIGSHLPAGLQTINLIYL